MSIRARIFFVFAATVIIGFTLLMNWISEDVSDRYSESFEEVMVDSANMLAELLGNDILASSEQQMTLARAFDRLAERRFSARIYELEKTHVDIRVYITDASGKVVFDSNNNAAVGEDYSGWLDVGRTLKGEYGARATRVPGEVSAGDPGQPLTVAYVAAPIYHHGDIVGSVTIAKPKSNIDRFVANARDSLKAAVLFSIAVALLLGLMLYIWVSQPLRKLVDFTNRVSLGERIAPLELGNNEIGEVAGAIENMRQALENKQYVENYVQSLTHELKSPLTSIQASAELLQQDLPADRRAQFTQTIIDETRRLNEFANQLLALSSLEIKQVLEQAKPLDLPAILEALINSHLAEAEKRQIQLELNIDPTPVVNGDAFLVKQAIDNLLRNAIDFSPEGGRVLLQLSLDDNRAIIEVSDQGPGIPDYALERIFERFYSLPRPHNARKSSGLGLTFAREVAQLHRGSLTLENRQPGTCARLVLPCRQPH